jgi:RNA polymerase sigma-70 factor (ECF subfamily)
LEHQITLQQLLIEKCKRGDTQAQHELYKQYVHAMYNVAYRICGNRYDAEDVLQESFLKAFTKLSSFKGEASFGSWLKRIVVNQSITAMRSRKGFLSPLTPAIESNTKEEADTWIDEDFPMEKVIQAIESLPDGARTVFTLKAIEEYKFSEISEMLGLSETNCKVQYHRSKKLLNEKLKVLVAEN